MGKVLFRLIFLSALVQGLAAAVSRSSSGTATLATIQLTGASADWSVRIEY